MKVVFALALLVAVAVANPQGQDKDAHVVKSELDNLGIGEYKFNYETSNGISASEQGHLESVGSENEHISVQGTYGYVGPDNVHYSVNYHADDTGFHAEGAHIPQL